MSAIAAQPSVAVRRGRRLGRFGQALVVYVPLVVLTFFLLAPFYWMILTSFKPDPELYSASISPLVGSVPASRARAALSTSARPSRRPLTRPM